MGNGQIPAPDGAGPGRVRGRAWIHRIRSQRRTLVTALIVALTVGLAAHLLHVGSHAGHEGALSSGMYHWLRDSALAIPLAALIVYAVNDLTRQWTATRTVLSRLRWGLLVGLGYAFALIPGGMAHGRLFPAEAHTGDAFRHAVADAVALLPASVYTGLAIALLFGMPSEPVAPIVSAFRRMRAYEWGTARWKPAPGAVARIPVALAAFLTILPAPAIAGPDALTELRAPTLANLQTGTACPGPGTPTTVTANVVALDQPYYYNRLGALNANGMMYALARDVVVQADAAPLAVENGRPITDVLEEGAFTASDLAGQVALRPDKRPRPLTLRVNEYDCLSIDFTNLLDPNPFIFKLPNEFLDLGGEEIDNQPVNRRTSIHVDGMELVGGIASDGSNVGRNNTPNALVAPGESTSYTYYADATGTHLLYDMGNTIGSGGNGASRSFGLFGAVNVEPGVASNGFPGSDWYRSQLTREEMDFAAASWAQQANGTWVTAAPSVDANGDLVIRYAGDDPANQPLVNYEARYPVGATVGGQNEIQSLSIVADGGTFDLGGATGLAHNSTAEQIQAALGDDFTVTLAVDGSFTIEFVGALASSPQELLTVNGTGLTQTDGTASATVSEVQSGVAPVVNPFFGTGKEGLPIVNILDGNEIVHSDLNAIIDDRGYPYPANAAYPTRSTGYASDGGDPGEPFREFTVIFHDEAFGVQAFPGLYNDPVLSHTLHGVADSFPINYGSGGIGSEIIANRLGVGPMWDCAECKYEEFFLTSFTVGDPAMIVDIPANFDQNGDGTPDRGAKATKALYPEDPSNVHHAYLGDRVIFRNLHAGPKEHHIFHLHAHQWLFNPDDPQSNYLDGQALGPGSAYSYEIAYGGSGNRNLTPGDSIFHCHFYPHFAQGMWELWRVHDTFERGTLMEPDPLDGLPQPVEGSRALPDGEIARGTPIPGVVPMPGMAMAPMPDPNATIVSYDLLADAETATFGEGNSSQFDANGDGLADINQSFDAFAAPDQTAGAANVDTDGDGTDDLFVDMINPGYPWFTPGLLGHRPPTPALDLAQGEADVDGDGVPDTSPGDVWGDGGLPRHVVTSGLDDTQMDVYVTRLDFNKVLHGAAGIQLPEHGTVVEQLAMAFHAGYADGDGNRFYDSYFPDGTPTGLETSGFEVNGLDPIAGAPFADPCRSFAGLDGDWKIDYPTGEQRLIKGANIEMPITLNKVGWHFQQQRFEALWDDVLPTLSEDRAPQPMIMRLNSTDCAEFWHTNLVPNVYQLDDYQVRTPTDIIGQHIHLVKFDVMSADGAANGWNYEDGTLSPDEVRERIDAFNHGGGFTDLNGVVRYDANNPLQAQAHPFFGAVGPDGQDWLGARTTIQRWYADPLLERSWDGGVGTVFTHDHYGPSTHQQVGLYSTLLVEPEDSVWRHNETGELLGTRHDGGPSGWQAIIEVPPSAGWEDLDGDGIVDPTIGGPDDPSHREFYFEFADFQHAYEAGGGAWNAGFVDPASGATIGSFADFDDAINPSVRQAPPLGMLADIYLHPNACPGLPQDTRPCPEAISADDPGTYALNFRNEPIGLRVYDPATQGQAAGAAGDLAFAYQSRVDRAIPELNSQPAGPYPPLTADLRPGDPYTPMLRVYMGDKVRIRVQVGAHEEEHNFTIPGLKWRQEPNSPNSGWRNSEFFGIDEYFNLDVPIVPDTESGTPAEVDYIYTVGAELEGMWNGVWGVLRSYGKERADLTEVRNNDVGRNGYELTNATDNDPTNDFDGICPVGADLREFGITAVRARDVLNQSGEPRQPGEAPGWLVYNDRTTALAAPPGGLSGVGPLIDPTALMYVLTEDVIFDAAGSPIGLKPGTPVEPLILRANAGDCITVDLTNALPDDLGATEMPGYNALPPIVHKDENADGLGGITSFNANDLTPSSHVGLTPQLLAFDPRTDGGFSTGLTTGKLVAPGDTGTYQWYAGDVRVTSEGPGPSNRLSKFTLEATPVEFGAVGLMPADRIKGSESGFIGAMVIEPAGSTWDEDPGTRTQATVRDSNGNALFRDFVVVMQNDVNMRFGGGGCAPQIGANGEIVGPHTTMECAVPSITAEGPNGPPEDPQDSGQKAINYLSDPLWYRLGITPDTPFEQIHRDTGLAELIPDVFANSITGSDPHTPVFQASPGGPDEGRFRVLMPGGHARGTTWTIHGHQWERQPYQCGPVETCDFTNGSSVIGDRNDPGTGTGSDYYGTQEGINPTGHWDFVVDLGGSANVQGDYLIRDQASFGSYQGLWGLLRYEAQPPLVGDVAVTVPKYSTTGPIRLGVDLDDGTGMTVLVTNATSGSGTVADPWVIGTGLIVDNGDGTVTYTSTGWPACGDAFSCTEVITYTAANGAGTSGEATLFVEVTNAAPVARPDVAELRDPDVTVDIPILTNDFDAEGDLGRTPLTVQFFDRGDTLGSAEFVGGVARYTFAGGPGFSGVDEIEYSVTDESGAESNRALIRVGINVDSITITRARYQENNARWQINGTCSVPGNEISVYFGISTIGTPLIGAGTCTADQLWSVTAPNPAAVTVSTTEPNFVSAVSNGEGAFWGFPVEIVGANNPPTANPDQYEGGFFNGTLFVAPSGVLGNDTDADLDPLTAAQATAASFGTVSLDPDGSFTYQPNPATYTGSDSFSYVASDGNDNSVPAQVNIRGPVGLPDSYTMAVGASPLVVGAPGVLGNDFGGANVTASVVEGPDLGTVVLAQDGSFEYTRSGVPSGVDTFTYQVCEAGVCSQATVSINATNDNSAPSATDDVYSVPAGSTLDIGAPGVLGNDTDPDPNTNLAAVLEAPPSNGALTFNANGSFTYSPDLNFSGIDTFTYRATDGIDASNVATVTINVTDVVTVDSASYRIRRDRWQVQGSVSDVDSAVTLYMCTDDACANRSLIGLANVSAIDGTWNFNGSGATRPAGSGPAWLVAVSSTGSESPVVQVTIRN